VHVHILRVGGKLEAAPVRVTAAGACTGSVAQRRSASQDPRCGAQRARRARRGVLSGGVIGGARRSEARVDMLAVDRLALPAVCGTVLAGDGDGCRADRFLACLKQRCRAVSGVSLRRYKQTPGGKVLPVLLLRRLCPLEGTPLIWAPPFTFVSTSCETKCATFQNW
jgi:hypothetical protein